MKYTEDEANTQSMNDTPADFIHSTLKALGRARREYGDCCKGLKGWALAWHKYSVHGGPKRGGGL